MRLIRLRIKNIASLKGEHQIDFKQIQEQSPLFAITGETGSGKSSILNSIGLALYGQIYKKNVNQLDVVTLGEKDGSIELIFQVKGKYYLADWRARVRKQNGEPYSTPQTPVRNLYVLEGPDFSDAKNIATLSTPELLNLDFDQFCKCIILNQGEFAKFLTSSFSDRKDILEKLYPGELLESMGRELRQELDALVATKNELEIKLGELKGDTYSGEMLKDDKARLEKELSSLEVTSKHIEKLDYHFVSLFSYYEKYSDNERKKEHIKRDMAQETTRLNHIIKSGEEIHERFQKVKKEQETELPLLQDYLKKEENLKHLKENHQGLKQKSLELNKEMDLLKGKIKTKEEEEKDSLGKLTSAKNALTHPLDHLKAARPFFENLFDLFSEKEILGEELKGKTERLNQLETTGKELKTQVEQIENALKAIPPNIKELEQDVEKRKLSLAQKVEIKQRAEIKSDELKKHSQKSLGEITLLEQKLLALNTLLSKTQIDIFPLEATLKLQEVLNASEVCVDHALSRGSDHCPVCEQAVSLSKWNSLKEKLGQTDLESIRLRFEEGNKILFKSQEEAKLYQQRIENEKAQLDQKNKEWLELKPVCDEILPSLADLDRELSIIREQTWNLARLEKELSHKRLELQKTRENYSQLKAQVSECERLLKTKTEKLTEIEQKISHITPVINRDTIRDLRIEVRNFNLYLECEAGLDKITQEKAYLTEQKIKGQITTLEYQNKENEVSLKINLLNDELLLALKGEKASELIQKITFRAQSTSEEWSRHVEEQKKQELILKDSNGRLYQLDELTKDYDLHFTNELHAVKELARSVESEQLIRLRNLDLTFSSPRELFLPLKDLLAREKEQYKSAVNQCRMNFATVSARLSDWEKLQDKIQLLELQNKDINEALARKMRLFEVLGKDELRTFVLSLVEENLIHQTNEELQKLCQGRYEIVHQTRSLKMTPEFFILDKFREGGRRKVSTLSGGETFMVSLAMALGLAEMTRGQAEIDSLFIDEGFGTLDQESLEDVLDMLAQIQTRGLMVGVISHIKTLTNALPVNLVLSKRQDGTSTIKVQFN